MPTRLLQRLARPHSQRGSTLIVTIVLVAVLTVVAAGLVERGNSSVATVNADRTYRAGVACADGARELLLSQFRAFNVDISKLKLDTTVAGQRIASGHYDSFNVESVRPLSGSAAIAQDNVMGMGNRSVATALGGAPYVFTVVCSDSAGLGRQTEVEFLIRFGI